MCADASRGRRAGRFQSGVCGAAHLVVQDAVPVRESAALDILPRQTDVVALHQERRPGQLLPQRPVDALARLDHGGAALQAREGRGGGGGG
eukprot:scaffold25671_cov45-Isochrysis_galbana.AAC.2